MTEDNLIDNPEVFWSELMKEIATWEDVKEEDDEEDVRRDA